MNKETDEAFMRLRNVCNNGSGDRWFADTDDHAKAVVSLKDLRLVVGWVHEHGLNSANDRIAAEKAADYDAIVRLLSRGLKGG